MTGSSGFIGSHVLAALHRDQLSVLGIDARPPASVQNTDFEFSQCDILDAARLKHLVATFAPEAVVHLAARTDIVGEDVNAYAANVQGTRNIVDAVTASGSVRRVLFASSQLVCRVGYVPRGDTDYCPVNPYGESKVLMEEIVREFMPDEITWCLVRPTTIWGEGMSAHYQRFLSLLQSRKYLQFGSGALLKTYGYVGNAVHQIGKFLNADAAHVHRRTFYLGDYQPLSLTAWTDSLARALGAQRPFRVPKQIAYALGGCGDVLNQLGWKTFPLNTFRVRNILTEYIFDLSETERICGPLPFSVDQGVERLARWFLQKQAERTITASASVVNSGNRLP